MDLCFGIERFVVLGEEVAEVGDVGDDDGDGLFGICVGVHADVRDEVAGFVRRLEAFQCDVL